MVLVERLVTRMGISNFKGKGSWMTSLWISECPVRKDVVMQVGKPMLTFFRAAFSTKFLFFLWGDLPRPLPKTQTLQVSSGVPERGVLGRRLPGEGCMGWTKGKRKMDAQELGLSGICKRGRQKGVSLICSDLFWKQIGRNRKKSGYSRKQGAQIGTNRKKTGKSEQIRTNRVDPLLLTPKWGLRDWPRPAHGLRAPRAWNPRRVRKQSRKSPLERDPQSSEVPPESQKSPRRVRKSEFDTEYDPEGPAIEKFNPDWSRDIFNPYAWEFQSRIEIFNLDWKFQSRLKISIPTLIIPHNRSLVFNLAWKFRSRLKVSIWDWSLESFNPGAKYWIFSIFGPSGDWAKFPPCNGNDPRPPW